MGTDTDFEPHPTPVSDTIARTIYLARKSGAKEFVVSLEMYERFLYEQSRLICGFRGSVSETYHGIILRPDV